MTGVNSGDGGNLRQVSREWEGPLGELGVLRRRIVALLLGAGLIVAGTAIASAQANLRVAVLDLQVVVSESMAGKQANANLQEFVRAKQAELDQVNARIDALQAELAGSGLSASARQAKQAELDALIDELQQLAARAQNEINARAEQLRSVVLNDIGQVLNIIGREQDYTLIIDKSSVFYYKMVVDITWEVVRRYDQLYEAAVRAAQEASASGGDEGGSGQ